VTKRWILPFVVSAALCAVPVAAQAQGQEVRRDIETTFAWSQAEAERKCAEAAAAENARWTGRWRTSVPGQTIYCEVVDLPDAPSRSRARFRQVEVGPVWNQADADVKCPRAATESGGRWTGQWRTTQTGVMSVCEISYESERVRDVEAGPIWSEDDARVKCPVAAYAVRGVWTGEWRTIRRGEMSVCSIADRERRDRR
jgi:hypothetical protein